MAGSKPVRLNVVRNAVQADGLAPRSPDALFQIQRVVGE